MNYNIVIFGVKDTTEYILKYLIGNRTKIDLIATIDKVVLEKNPISGYKSLEKIAINNSIKLFKTKDYSLKDKKSVRFFSENNFEIGISIGWQRLIPNIVLNSFKIGIFGFHGSCGYLPYGRGRSPLNWTIINGDTRFINHLFKYSEKPDWVYIHSIRTFEVTCHDTIRTLQYKTLLVGREQILNIINEKNKGTIQLFQLENICSSWYKKRTFEDGKINLKMKTREIYNLVRGVTKPFPGAYMYIDNERVYIWDLKPFDQIINFKNNTIGEIVEILDGNLIVKTIDGSIIINDYSANIELRKGMKFQ